MADFDELTQAERYRPTLSVEDGYLKIGIPLGAVAIALQQAKSEDRNMLLTVAVDEAPIVNDEIDIVPADVIFASGLCIFSESRREFLVLDDEIRLTRQQYALMRALARNVDRLVSFEALIDEANLNNDPTKSRPTGQRLKVVQNRLSEVRCKAGEVVPALADRKHGLIRRLPKKGYSVPSNL